jgi:hypothetical protein
LTNALAEEIHKIIDQKAPKDVYGMLIKQKYHRLLRRNRLHEVQKATNTFIMLPGHAEYSTYRTPINANELPDLDGCIAKIVGNRSAFSKARHQLSVCHLVFFIPVVVLILLLSLGTY